MILEGRPLLPGQTGHFAGRKLLADMYFAHTGASLPRILTTPEGKPYFENSAVHFSISHSKGHVFCALAEHPIGIDAEEADRQIDLRLAEKILSAREREQFALAEDPRQALLTFWVLKEASAKHSGKGLQGYPRHTAFSLDDPRVRKLDGCLVAVVEG